MTLGLETGCLKVTLMGTQAEQIWGGRVHFRHGKAEEPVEQPRARGLRGGSWESRSAAPGENGKTGEGEERARKQCYRQKSLMAWLFLSSWGTSEGSDRSLGGHYSTYYSHPQSTFFLLLQPHLKPIQKHIPHSKDYFPPQTTPCIFTSFCISSHCSFHLQYPGQSFLSGEPIIQELMATTNHWTVCSLHKGIW